MAAIDRILTTLNEGPATSFEIAAELDIKPGTVSAYLSQLRTLGLVKVTSTVPACIHCGRGSPAYIYEVVDDVKIQS